MKLNVKKKLLLSFSAVLVLLTILSGITYFELKNINSNYSSSIEERLNKISLAVSMAENSYKEQAAVRGYLLTGSEQQINSFVEASLSFKKSSNKLLDISVTGTDGHKLTQKMIDLEGQYRDISDQLMTLKKQNKKAAYIKLMDNAAPIVTDLRQTATDLVKYQQTSLLEKSDQLSDQTADTQRLILIISLLTIIIGLVIALLISRQPFKTSSISI